MWTHAHAWTQRNPLVTHLLSLTESHTHSSQAVSHWGEQENKNWLSKYTLLKGRSHVAGPNSSRPEEESHSPRLWSHPSFTIATSFIMAGMSLGGSVYVKCWNFWSPAEGSTKRMFFFLSFSFSATSKRIKQTNKSPPLFEVHHLR